ncbi:Defensin-like protein [Morella rubra]|uniref:Defensin-like protein n=1 Tax=Morella rubra TaxID=262757 RepID=A0A6A1UNX1_9ROSI|nr:Defensin-like protein [Morella rubra]
MTSTINIAYKTHRNRMFQHYSVFNSKEEALEHPYPEMNKEEWISVCDLFASEEFQRRSAINKENRAKLKIVHTSGARSFQRTRALLVTDDARASADDGGAAVEERRRADADDGGTSMEERRTASEDDAGATKELGRTTRMEDATNRTIDGEQMMEQIRQLQSVEVVTNNRAHAQYVGSSQNNVCKVTNQFVHLAEMGPVVAEARICATRSQHYKGLCLRKSNCAAVCQTEGFPGGECRSIRFQCFCTKQC